jgi:peptide/nickel transport system substrate-binding protein
MWRAVLIACLVALTCAACTKQQARESVHNRNVLTIALRKEPISLNPLYLEGTDAYTFGELFFLYLTRYDSSGRSVGDLALAAPTLENGGVTDGGKRLTYHLRHGVHWQDGTPVTSRDVVFTYREIMNPANTVDYRLGYDRITSIAARDPYTLTITVARPFSPIIGYFFGGDSNYAILPAHLLGSLPNLNASPFNTSPVGSGPYRLRSWNHGDRLTVDANSSYYAGTPAIPELVLPFVSDDSTRIEQLQTGEVDAAFLLDASRIAALRAIPGHRVVVTPVPYFYAVAFNLRDPVLADAAVRRAIALSIDRRTLTRKITSGVYDADTALRGLFTWAYDPSVAPVPYDPATAAKVLAADGWAPGSDGIRVKNGKRLSLQLVFPNGQPITTRFAVAIAAAVRAAGIDLTLRGYDRQQFIARDGPELGGHYQVSLYDYQGSFDPDPSWLLACDQRAPQGFNVAGYCDRTTDALIQRAAASFERSARIADYKLVQRRMLDSLPYDVICQISEVDVIPNSLRGFAPPLLSPFNSVAAWRWARPTRPKD